MKVLDRDGECGGEWSCRSDDKGSYWKDCDGEDIPVKFWCWWSS